MGIDIDSYKKWIEVQLTPDMNWSEKEIDHIKPKSLFIVSDDERLKEAFNWKNTQPLLKEVHQHKGTKFDLLDFRLQFIKALYFSKPNEEGHNEKLHRSEFFTTSEKEIFN